MVKHCIAFGCQNRSSKPKCKKLSWHSLPLRRKTLLAQWLVKLRRENTPITKTLTFVVSILKPVALQNHREDKEPEKPKRKKPADRATINTSKRKTVKSLFESKNIEFGENSADCLSSSDGGGTEHLENED